MNLPDIFLKFALLNKGNYLCSSAKLLNFIISPPLPKRVYQKLF